MTDSPTDASTALPPELAPLPQHRPTQPELDRLELLLAGALPPIAAYTSREEFGAVRAGWRLPDTLCTRTAEGCIDA